MTGEKGTGTWLKVFCPDARCLDEAEIAALPEAQKRLATGRNGLWLDVFCPDRSCLAPEEVAASLEPAADGGEPGVWLKLFCPSGACEGNLP